jgi:secondary thiamine-phosphate synthase enzyme
MHAEIFFGTKSRLELVNLTEQVREIVTESDVKNGICLVYTPHSTGGLLVNESADPALEQDILSRIEKLVPSTEKYYHDRLENNGHAHVKAALMPTSQVIPVINSRLQLGTWQSIFFAEFDGPQQKRSVIVMLIKASEQ